MDKNKKLDDIKFINSKIRFPSYVLTSDKRIITNSFNESLIVKTKFVNLSGSDIVVCFRDGSITRLPPQKAGPYMDSLVISHSKDCSVFPMFIIAGDEDEQANMLRSQLLTTNGRDFEWEEVIEVANLKNSRHGIYSAAADVLITLNENITTLDHHPFCRQRVHNLYLNLGDNFDSKTDISMGIRLIDNEGTQSRLYAIVHDRIMVVSPKRSNTLLSGIYITGLTKMDSFQTNGLRQDQYFSVEDVLLGKSPILMFESLAMARDTLNRVQHNEDSDRKNKEHEKLINTMKLEREKLEQENALLKMRQLQEKTKLEELEARRIKELQQQKLEYERKIEFYKTEAIKHTNQHKFWTETIKTAGLGIGLLITAWKVLK